MTPNSIGDRNDGVCLFMHGQKPNIPNAAISYVLDSKGRAFVLIQVLYRTQAIVSCTFLETIVSYDRNFYGMLQLSLSLKNRDTIGGLQLKS